MFSTQKQKTELKQKKAIKAINKTTIKRMKRPITVYSFNDVLHEYKMTKNDLQLKL